MKKLLFLFIPFILYAQIPPNAVRVQGNLWPVTANTYDVGYSYCPYDSSFIRYGTFTKLHLTGTSIFDDSILVTRSIGIYGTGTGGHLRLYDEAESPGYVQFGLENDAFGSNLTILLPPKNGTVALTSDTTLLHNWVNGQLATKKNISDTTGATGYGTINYITRTFVPYAGATTDVNIGTHTFTAGRTNIGGAYNTYSADYDLQVGTETNNHGIIIRSGVSSIGKVSFDRGFNGDGTGRIWYDHSTNSMGFYTSSNGSNSVLALSIGSDQSTVSSNDITYILRHAVASADSIAYTVGGTGNTYYKIATGALLVKEVDSMVVAGDSIQILTPGDYAICVHLAASTSNANDQIRVRLKANNAFYSPQLSRWTILSNGSGTNIQTFEHTWYLIHCTRNEWHSVYVNNLSGNRAINITDFGFFIYKLPEQ